MIANSKWVKLCCVTNRTPQKPNCSMMPRLTKYCQKLSHFQGWSSSCDCYLTDKFIIKDTEENRELQKKLAIKARLIQEGHLYKKECKQKFLMSDTELLNSELTDKEEEMTNKFKVGEQVLCYEPITGKPKLLYDAKVKKLLPEKNNQSHKSEYLIHFQGWSSSWDCYLTDKFIMKDTEENRELQKKLAVKARLVQDEHLYRKERKRKFLSSDTESLNSELSDKEEMTNNDCKFEVGELVLCYEPDTAKTKLLYDAKVKKILSEKNDQSRKSEYLIHFQGWSSSCDCYLTDKFIIKDTEENRELQKKLAIKARLIQDGHLYRKEGKQRSNTKSLNSKLSDEEEEEEEENEYVGVPSNTIVRPKRKLSELLFCDYLKDYIGYTCNLTKKNYLVYLPCQPNVVTLLENYLKYSAETNFHFGKLPKKAHLQEALNNNEIEKRYNISIEIIDSLRLLFNYFLLRRLMATDSEKAQYYNAIQIHLEPPVVNTLSQNTVKSFQNNESNGQGVEDNHSQVGDDNDANGVTTQSQRSCSECSLSKRQCSKCLQVSFNKAPNKFVSDANKWKAVPDSEYNKNIKQPAIIYGVHHLLRFLEILPKILQLTELEGDKLDFVYLFCNGLLSYISTQRHLLGIKDFVNPEMKEK